MASFDQALAAGFLPWIDALLLQDRIGCSDDYNSPWTRSLFPTDTVFTAANPTCLEYPDPCRQSLPHFDEVLVNNYLAGELFYSPQLDAVLTPEDTTNGGVSSSSYPSSAFNNGIYSSDGTYVPYLTPSSPPEYSIQVKVEPCDIESPFVLTPQCPAPLPPVVPRSFEVEPNASTTTVGEALAGSLASSPSHTDVASLKLSTPAPEAIAVSATTRACDGRGKRPRSQNRASGSASAPRTAKSKPSASRDLPSTELKTIARRNAIVSSSTTGPAAIPSGWKCPHCPYVQLNRRKPDFKRHVETHTRPCAADAALWVCCGVPLIDAREEYGVPEKVLEGEPFVYKGMFMVGGCRRVFSRRDALSRHLRTYVGVCFGDAQASYLPGNRVGAR